MRLGLGVLAIGSLLGAYVPEVSAGFNCQAVWGLTNPPAPCPAYVYPQPVCTPVWPEIDGKTYMAVDAKLDYVGQLPGIYNVKWNGWVQVVDEGTPLLAYEETVDHGDKVSGLLGFSDTFSPSTESGMANNQYRVEAGNGGAQGKVVTAYYTVMIDGETDVGHYSTSGSCAGTGVPKAS